MWGFQYEKGLCSKFEHHSYLCMFSVQFVNQQENFMFRWKKASPSKSGQDADHFLF